MLPTLPRGRNRLVAFLVSAGFLFPASGPGRAGDLPAYSRHVLDNGLTVLLAEEHSQPLVSVTSWFRVGARNERPGITGIAHYLEHMAFRATENISGSDVFGQIERLGGHWHGYTRFDNTAYYETARRESLEWLLFLEAERMQRCRILPAEVEIERGSILSELKGYENDPWSLLFDEVAAAAFREHPYGYNISGWVSDLEAITHADLVDFYRRHYAASNAILVAVGDFDPRQALAAVRRHFASLPPRPPLPPLRTVEPPQRGEKRVTLRMPGSAPHVLVAHHAPAFADSDFFPFLVLDALLSGGRGVHTLGSEPEIGLEAADRRSSRLFRELVATGLASRATTGFIPTLHPYLHTVTAEAAAGADPDALEEGIIAALERLAEQPPPAEELSAARRRLSTLARLQADSYQDVAHLLATLEAFGGLHLWGKIDAAIEAVGPAQVQAAARRALRADNRTVGRFEPRAPGGENVNGGEGSAGFGSAATAAATAALPDPPSAPSAAGRRSAPPIKLGRVEPPPPAARRTLASGLELAAVGNPWVSTAALAVDIDAGPLRDPGSAEGLAALTARLLSGGSEERTAAETAAAIDRLGLRWEVHLGGTRIDFPDPRRIRIELEFAARDLDEVTSLLAASLRSPAFPADTFRTARQAQISEAAALEDDTEGLARARLVQSLYAGTPHGRLPLGSAQTLAGLGRADVQRFHARNYRPERTRIAFAGGLRAEQALAALERAFSGWTPAAEEGAEGSAGPSPSPPPSAAMAPPDPVRLAHKTQVDLAYGFFTGLETGSADAAAFEALQYVVQHGFYAGRLGERIVGKEGLAYSVESHLARELPGAPLLMATGAPPEKVGRLRKLWEETLDEVGREGITPRELEAARTYLEGRRLHERETNLSAALAALAEMGSAGRASPSSATLDGVNRLARRIFGGRKAIWSLAGPLPH